MASTPSASALSAVLRCRGNIFARNKKRPPPGSGYSLGAKCGAAGESAVPILGKEHGWEFGQTLQEFKSFFLGQRVEIRNGVFLTVTLETSRKSRTDTHSSNRTAINDKERRKVSKTDSQNDPIGSLYFLQASSSRAAQQCYRLRFLKEPNSSQTRLFTSGIRECLGIKNCDEYGMIVHSKSNKKLLGKLLDSATWKVLCVSISYLPKSDRPREQISKPVALCWKGWTTLKNGCIILTAVISEMLRMQLGMENGRLSIPSVFKPAVLENLKSHSFKRRSFSISHSAQTMENDLNGQSGDTTDQKVKLGGLGTSGEHQPLGGITKMGKLD